MLDLPALDAVTDADRAWFQAHPARRYRLRPTAVAELLPGQVMCPGSRTVVATAGSPLVRFRVPVGRPPLPLRQDTDRTCEALLRAMDAAGYTINGQRLVPTIEALGREVAQVLGSRP